MPSGPRTRAREPVAIALASGATIADAAVLGGVSPRTVDGWLQEPVLRARVGELQGVLVDRTAGALARAMGEAVETLRVLLSSSSETVRLRAADAMLRHGMAAFELRQMARQIEEIREQIAELDRE